MLEAVMVGAVMVDHELRGAGSLQKLGKVSKKLSTRESERDTNLPT